MTSAAELRRLEFDSDLFGMKVGTLEFDERSPDSDLQAMVERAREESYRLVYLTSEVELDIDAHSLGVESVYPSQKVTFTKGLVHGPVAGSEALVSIPTGDVIDDELYDLALASGHNSRFRLDPKIPAPVFVRLYRLWIERSVSGEIADRVIAAKSRNEIDGLVTIKAPEGGSATIGLIAVSSRRRGCGIGTALIDAAERHATRAGCPRLNVSTQAANEGACRLYTRAGFDRAVTTNIYHLWFPPPIRETV